MRSAAGASRSHYGGALLGVASAALAQQLVRGLGRLATARPVTTAPSPLHLRLLAFRRRPEVIVLNDDLVGDAPLAEALRPLIPIAPVVLIAPPGRQEEAARFVSEGNVEFVAQVGNYVPIVAGLVARRIRPFQLPIGLSQAAADDNTGAIFRHELNNLLVGILGGAEFVLDHNERLSAPDTQQLQTVVDCAVQMRETIRRLSDAWERHPNSLTPA